jgi:hypothetical protein
MIDFIVVIMWLACGVIQWGLMYAFFTGKYQNMPESRVSHIFLILSGPMGLLAALSTLWIHNGFKKAFMYGFKL